MEFECGTIMFPAMRPFAVGGMVDSVVASCRKENRMAHFFHVFKAGRSIAGPMDSKAGACLECIQTDGESVVELDIFGNTVQQLNRTDCQKLVTAVPSPR